MALDNRTDDISDSLRYADDDLQDELPGLADEGVADEPETEDEESLDDLDPGVRERVDRVLARERETLRGSLREVGLDLNQDGRPLIADVGKVSQWGLPQYGRAPEPAAPVAPAPAPVAPVEEPEAFDPLAADALAYERFTERVAEKAVQKATGPLLQEIERLRGVQQRRVESEVTSEVREIVKQYMPEIEGALDHPDFDGMYRRAIAGCSPEQLENRAQVAGIAGWVRTQLDPARMPAARRDGPPAAALAVNRANRDALGQTAPSRQGGAAPQESGRNADDEWGTRFLGRMRENMSDSAGRRVEVSAAAWRDLGECDNLEDYKRAKAERAVREQRSGRRR